MSPETVHHAKRAVIDWHAALLAGSASTPATLLQKAFAAELQGGGGALLPLGGTAPARLAALINGAAAHTGRGRRHLPRRHLPPRRADHRRRARPRAIGES